MDTAQRLRRAASPAMALLIGLSAVVLSSTAPVCAAQGGGPTPPPDPALGDGGVSAFYVWEHEVPDRPGRLLRQEPVPDHLVLTNAARGLRVLYTSTDGVDGRTAIAVSGAVYFPKGSAPAGGWPIVAWAHGTTGTADVCAPSWMSRSKRDTDYLNAWLAQGFAVVASDYQGLGTPGGHPWMQVRPEGWSVLDGVRSALAGFPELANAVVIVGQSQGSHAALSAAGLASTYAPTLKIKGTVATGVSGGPQLGPARRTSTFLFLILHKFRVLDPAFEPSDYLTEAGGRAFAAAATTCVRPGQTVPLEEVLKAWPNRAKTEAVEDYPTLRFAHPVFAGIGLADTAALPEFQYGVVSAACRAGTIVETHYYPGQDHGGTVNASLVDSVPFVKRLFAAQPITGNCATIKAPPKTREAIAPEGGSGFKVVLVGTRSGPATDARRLGISTLILAGGEQLLFDCGRGLTTGMARLALDAAGVTKAFLTHLHSDHIVSLPELLLFPWAQGRAVPMRVWGPEGTRAMVSHLQQAFSFDIRVRRDVDEQFASEGIRVIASDVREGMVYQANGVTVSAFLVDHGPVKPAFGYRVDYHGHSVALSGDTKPSEGLIRNAQGVDVLIHELGQSKQLPVLSGPPDEVIPNSRFTRRQARAIVEHHTDAAEVGTVFRRVGPKLAVFSHYPNIVPADILPVVKQNYAGRVEFGEDLMTIEIGSAINISRFVPANK